MNTEQAREDNKEKFEELKHTIDRQKEQAKNFLSNEEIDSRTKWHPPTSDEVVSKHSGIRNVLNEAIRFVNETVPEGREKSLAITKLKEAMMWANAGIARNQ